MNLRQIIRNQKLQNYSLQGVIGEAEGDAAAVDADAGVTAAGSKKFWFTNDKGKYVDRVKDPGAGWRLVDSDEAEKAVEQDKPKKSKEEEPEKKTEKDSDEESLQRQMAKEPMPGEEASDDDGDEERETAKAELDPATEPKSEQEIKDFRTTMFGAKPGKSSSWTGRNEQSTPSGDPPSDAMARQTAFDLGYPGKGEDRGNSKVTGQPAAPAPGNAGSMMNEVFSVEGCNIAEEFYEQFGTTPTADDIENVLQQQFGNTQLAEDNGGPNSSEYRKKLRISAEAAVTKFERLKDGEANNADTDPPFGKMIRPPSEFYGAGDSIEAQAEMIRRLDDDATIFGPDGPITE